MKVPSVLTIQRGLQCERATADAVQVIMRSDQPARQACNVLNALLSGQGVRTIENEKGVVTCWYVDRGAPEAVTVLLACNTRTGKWFWRVGALADWRPEPGRKQVCPVADALR